jgi:RNA methyltransferase, TrmH family
VPVADAVAAAVQGPLALVLDAVADPGNAGTLLRAAEAAGAAAVVFCRGSVDPSSPKCVRAAAGALFRLPVAVGGETTEVLEQLRGEGVATAATDVVDLRLTIPMAGPTESLNVAMAGTVVCFESLRQRSAGR